MQRPDDQASCQEHAGWIAPQPETAAHVGESGDSRTEIMNFKALPLLTYLIFLNTFFTSLAYLNA